jgi:large subunit ribosomal protein L35
VPRKLRTKGKFKLKTHKATAKRFRVTGSGKVLRTKGGKSHLRRRKSARVKAQLGDMIPVKGKKIRTRVRRLAPYLSLYRANPTAKSGGKNK